MTNSDTLVCTCNIILDLHPLRSSYTIIRPSRYSLRSLHYLAVDARRPLILLVAHSKLVKPPRATLHWPTNQHYAAAASTCLTTTPAFPPHRPRAHAERRDVFILVRRRHSNVCNLSTPTWITWKRIFQRISSFLFSTIIQLARKSSHVPKLPGLKAPFERSNTSVFGQKMHMLYAFLSPRNSGSRGSFFVEGSHGTQQNEAHTPRVSTMTVGSTVLSTFPSLFTFLGSTSPGPHNWVLASQKKPERQNG